MQHDATTAAAPTRLWTAMRWLSALVVFGIVVMAALIGQGVWGGERGLINGHRDWGIAVLVLAVIQFILAVTLYQRKRISWVPMVLSFIIVALLVGQMGLGFSSRQNKELVAWHVPLGVLLMSLTTLNATLIWLRRPVPTALPANHAR
jgi:cytochrome b561